MTAGELFEANLELIDRVVAVVCRRARLAGADAEDFQSQVKLALIEDDYAILRRYQGRASLAAFLSVVVQNLFYDQRTHALGRWRASREAERLGEIGVMLEKLVRRDGRSIDEALPLLQRVDASLTHERAVELLARLPERARRPRLVELESDAPIPAPDLADTRAEESYARGASQTAGRIVRETLATLPQEDRMIIRFRFGSSMTVADISTMLRLPQRPLYRRIESLLGRMRSALAAAGIDARTAADLIGSVTAEMDFGLDDGKTTMPRQSTSVETAAEEAR